MDLVQTIQEADRLQREELKALVDKTKIVKKNPKSTVIEYNGRVYHCRQDNRGFWSAKRNGRVWISGFYNDFFGLRVYIAKHG